MSDTHAVVAGCPQPRMQLSTVLPVSAAGGALLAVAASQVRRMPLDARLAVGGIALLAGAVAGAIAGAGAWGLDGQLGGALSKRLSQYSWRKLLPVLRNPQAPWLGLEGYAAARDAREMSTQLFHRRPANGAHDAFRHAYGSALLVMRAEQKHGASRADSLRYASELGIAQEDAVTRDPTFLPRQMDLANNSVGRSIAVRLLDADLATEPRLRAAVLDAMAAGELTVIDRRQWRLRPTNSSDLPGRRPAAAEQPGYSSVR